MDNTSMDAVLARKAGMSYGQWKILHPETAPKKAERKMKYHRICPECGAEFDTNRVDKIYCNPDCARLKNDRIFGAKRRAKQNAMPKL
jgi:hypothetical protein